MSDCASYGVEYCTFYGVITEIFATIKIGTHIHPIHGYAWMGAFLTT